MPRKPNSVDDSDSTMFGIDGEEELTDNPVDPEEAAFADLEESRYASFDEALEAIQQDSLDPFVLTGFSDITRKQVHQLRKIWTELPDEEARRTIADHVAALGLDDIRLDFMRFFRVLIDDPSPVVRQLAAAGLEPYDDPTLVEPLVRLAQHDPSDDVRLAALGALESFAMLGEFEMLEPKEQHLLRTSLMSLASDADQPTRLRAAALVSVSADSETPRVRKAIAAHFESGDPDLRLGAVKAMGRAYDPAWIDILETMLRSGDPDERQAAVQSLAQYEDEGVVPMLTQIAREDLEMPVRLEAIAGLGTIGGRSALHNLNTLREYVSDDEIDAVDAAIAEVEETIAIEEGTADEAFVHDPDLEDDDDY